MASKRGGSTRKGKRSGDVLPPDFVGIIDEHGKVLIDDTTYFRIRAQEKPIVAGYHAAIGPLSERLFSLINSADQDRRSRKARFDFAVELQKAATALEFAARDYVVRVFWETKGATEPKGKGKRKR